MNNLPAETDPAAALYRQESGRQYHDAKRFLSPEALDWVMALRAKKFQKFIRPSDVVLEFGCGAGWNLGRLRCARRIGCDAAEFLRERVTALGVEFITGLEMLPNGGIDVLICHQTLEHLFNPSDVLSRFVRLFKPAGRLILHVPWERERRYSRYRADEPNHHLYNWNAQNIGNLLTLLGYKLEHIVIRKYGYDRFAANLAVRLRAGEPGFRLLRAVLVTLRPLLEIEVIAGR
jgi:SAM-dependent methyltransferase